MELSPSPIGKRPSKALKQSFAHCYAQPVMPHFMISAFQFIGRIRHNLLVTQMYMFSFRLKRLMQDLKNSALDVHILMCSS